jgi:hypothetical protein
LEHVVSPLAVFLADLTRLAYDQAERLPGIVDDRRLAEAAARLHRAFAAQAPDVVDAQARELIREVTAACLESCVDATELADTLDACVYHLHALIGHEDEIALT